MTAPELFSGFSTQKREILLTLKRTGELSLKDLAHALGISRVAALRHLTALESQRLIERSFRAGGVGRPRAYFRLAPTSGSLFPQAYTQMSVCALQFIEERLGHDAVVELLQQRARDLSDQSRERFRSESLTANVAALAQLRQEGGYMAEVGARRRSSVEMLEHNCPILAIAQEFPEACDVERHMFESLLKARVDVSHRVVAGDPVCRFVIRPREARA
ncbi:MAG TPA: winged helix-turn-helix transcriptional regulator [Thermoplasmata archaeon]|nr:winged helix-turn-helix transcriptional regulator [Thermoplasmata archaeon]